MRSLRCGRRRAPHGRFGPHDKSACRGRIDAASRIGDAHPIEEAHSWVARRLVQHFANLQGMKSFGDATGERLEAGTGFWTRLGSRILATRPHFFALPIGAALAGISSTGPPPPPGKVFLAAVITGGGWATGQLWNDILDREADAIDAPDRAAVRGLLPPKATITVALLLGLGLLSLLILHTADGWLLALASLFLILTYNQCKAIPGLGNLSHGALMGCASLVGASIARPHLPLEELVTIAPESTLLVAAWAGLYLQGNYEKDMRGDKAAGYHTLAHVLGCRTSALGRASLALILGFFLVRALESRIHFIVAALGVLAVLLSALRVAARNTSAASLQAYRWTVHGAIFGMLALGGPALTQAAFVSALALAVALTEFAFFRSPNP